MCCSIAVLMQASLEEALFRIMYSRGFREDYICRYKMVTSFFQQKRPLIILLCGVSGTGTADDRPSANMQMHKLP